MPNLPMRLDDDFHSPRTLRKATNAREKTELGVYRAQLDARLRAAVDEGDARALADVIECAGVEELRVLDRLLDAAGDSPARKAIVARLSTLHSDKDLRRIARFGE